MSFNEIATVSYYRILHRWRVMPCVRLIDSGVYRLDYRESNKKISLFESQGRNNGQRFTKLHPQLAELCKTINILALLTILLSVSGMRNHLLQSILPPNQHTFGLSKIYLFGITITEQVYILNVYIV